MVLWIIKRRATVLTTTRQDYYKYSPPAIGGPPSASPAADNERSTRSWRTGAHQSTSMEDMMKKLLKMMYCTTCHRKTPHKRPDVKSFWQCIRCKEFLILSIRIR